MWLIPTRNRPDGMARLIDCMRTCGDVPQAAVMIDRDGSEERYALTDWPEHWHIHTADHHLELIGALNELVRLHPDEPWYGTLSDRSRPYSQGWSEALVAQRGNGWANADNEGRRGIHTGRPKMVEGVMNGDIVRAVGWFFPPWLTHFFGDELWEEVLQDAGLWHQTDVQVGHEDMARHPRLYQGRRYHDDDWSAWRSWRASGGVVQMVSQLKGAGLC